ncbi:MAG: hypothetical protein KC503_43590 [Myxococcales bacterium]|nr:hypothetical protein [Myxococcales bacterium]
MVEASTQRRLAVALWLIYALLSAGLAINDGVANALFLARVGATDLPLVFIAKALLDMLGAALYVRVDRRLGARATLVLLLVFAALGSAGAWLGVRALPGAWTYLALFAFEEVCQTLLKIHWGVYLLERFDAVSARRYFPSIYTGARVGAVAGGLMLGPLAGPLGPSNLMLVAALLFVAATVAVLARSSATPRDHESDAVNEADVGPLRALGRVRSALSSSLVRATAVATPLMVLSRYALRYRYSALLSSVLGEVELARVYGLYVASANTLAVLVQLFVTARLYALPSGVTSTNIGYALTLPAALALMWRVPSLLSALVGRVVESELKVALKTPLSNLFYGVLPAEQRAAARALVLGLIVPLATLVAAALLRRPAWLDSWALPCAAAFVLASLLQNRAYRSAER